MTTTPLKLIVEFLLGRKYYANVVRTRGLLRHELSAYIFPTRQAAQAHRDSLDDNPSFKVVETVSFRSRNTYDSTLLGR